MMSMEESSKNNNASGSSGSIRKKIIKMRGYPCNIVNNTAFIKNILYSTLQIAMFEGAPVRTQNGILGKVEKDSKEDEEFLELPLQRIAICTFQHEISMNDIVILRVWAHDHSIVNDGDDDDDEYDEFESVEEAAGEFPPAHRGVPMNNQFLRNEFLTKAGLTEESLKEKLREEVQWHHPRLDEYLNRSRMIGPRKKEKNLRIAWR